MTYGQVPDLVRENCSSGRTLRVWPSRSSDQIPIAVVGTLVIIIECVTGEDSAALLLAGDCQPTRCVAASDEFESHLTIIVKDVMTIQHLRTTRCVSNDLRRESQWVYSLVSLPCNCGRVLIVNGNIGGMLLSISFVGIIPRLEIFLRPTKRIPWNTNGGRRMSFDAVKNGRQTQERHEMRKGGSFLY